MYWSKLSCLTNKKFIFSVKSKHKIIHKKYSKFKFGTLANQWMSYQWHIAKLKKFFLAALTGQTAQNCKSMLEIWLKIPVWLLCGIIILDLKLWKHTDAGTNSTMGAWYGGLTGWATMNCSLFFISAEILLGIIHELELAKMVFSLLTAPSIWPHTLTLRVQLWEGGHNSSMNLAVGFWVWYYSSN